MTAQRSPAGPDSPISVTLHKRLSDAHFRAELARTEVTADVMLRGYAVQSKLPLIGRFIVWIRRNLTSHLREPYMDPMFERQVTFNRQVLNLIRQLVDLDVMTSARPDSARPPLSDDHARLLAARLDLLSLQLNTVLAQSAASHDDSNRFATLASRIAGMQDQLGNIQQMLSGLGH